MASLVYIQSFDKFDNFIGTSFSKSEAFTKILSFNVYSTGLIFKVVGCFFKWVISFIMHLIWSSWDFTFLDCFWKKCTENSTQFTIGWHTFIFLLSDFSHFLKIYLKQRAVAAVFQNVLVSVIFLISRLLKYLLFVFLNSFLQNLRYDGYGFLSENFFDFKILFPDSDLFVMTLCPPLVINGAAFARLYFPLK